jgi:hypothetical protein
VIVCAGYSYGFQSGPVIYYGSQTSCSDQADILDVTSYVERYTGGGWPFVDVTGDQCFECSSLQIAGAYVWGAIGQYRTHTIHEGFHHNWSNMHSYDYFTVT